MLDKIKVSISEIKKLAQAELADNRSNNNRIRSQVSYSVRSEPPIGFVPRSDPNFYFLARR